MGVLDAPAVSVVAGRKLKRLRGTRMVSLGDSTTIGTTVVSTLVTPPAMTSAGGRAWPQQAMLASSKGAFQFVYNAGVSGETLAQIRTRIPTQVVPFAPDYCTVLGGTNDFANGRTFAQAKADYIGICTDLVAAGIEPILCTITPRSDTTGLRQLLASMNHWIRAYARANGWICVDFYSVLVDPATGGYLAAFDNGDHVHPSFAGHKAMANAFVAAVSGRLPVNPFPLAWDNLETINLVPNGLFLNDTNADGVADNLVAGGASTGVTRSLVTDSAIVGKWQVITAAATASTTTITESGSVVTAASGQFVAGDTMQFGCRIKTTFESAATSSYFIRIHTQNADGSNDQSAFWPLGNDNKSDWTDGWLGFEFIVPAGVGRMYADFGVLAGTGTFQIAQKTWVNKTALGLP